MGFLLSNFLKLFSVFTREKNLTLSNKRASFKNWTLRNKPDVGLVTLAGAATLLVAEKLAGAGQELIGASTYCWER